MTYGQMMVATLAGFLYGPVLWFFSDFSIVIKHHMEKDLTGLFQSCGLMTNTLFACYAYYFIQKAYSPLLRYEVEEYRNLPWKLGPISLIHFGFLFPSLIVYPSEAVCYVWYGGSKYWFQRILFSHPIMICIVMLFETIGLHGKLLQMFRNQVDDLDPRRA
jgi:hypothetical protein